MMFLAEATVETSLLLLAALALRCGTGCSPPPLRAPQ